MRDTTVEADVRHLGVLVGDPSADRIVAVSTSTVFEDSSLPQLFWGVEAAAIDSGFQGHMYTRPNDILVVSVPRTDRAVAEQVTTAVGVNHELWRSLTGIELASAASRLVLAGEPTPPLDPLPANVSRHAGSMLEAAASRYRHGGATLLAFVFDDRLAEVLGLGDPVLVDQARATSLLMDKNVAMRVLVGAGVDCPETFAVDEDTELELALSRIPPSGRYVFKPAGGAAGIGVYGIAGGGAEIGLIRAHLDELRDTSRLPGRFQIQEFLAGTPFGITAWFGADGTYAVLEAHRQEISAGGRFVGGRWTAALQAEQQEDASRICGRLAGVERPRFSGLVCLDVIDGKVIEVNPRLTASAPIAHLLRRQSQLARHLGGGFQVAQIDLDSSVDIPYEAIRSGTLRSLIEALWRERRVLVLPQGLNPFGASRVVFVNDDVDGTAQRVFAERIRELHDADRPV